VKVAHVHRMRGVGGSERHLLALLPALAERGLDVQFVGLDDPDWDPRDFYDALAVPATRIRAPRDVDPLLVARLLRALRADIVHTHLVHADVYGGLAAILRREHLVSTKHNDDPFRRGPYRYLDRGLARASGRVVAITDSLRRFLVETVGLPSSKVETIHYGLDGVPEAWGENPSDTVPREARIVLAVARLTAQKGIDVAIRALRSLPADTHLVVLGEGPDREALERLAADLEVASRVHLVGRVADVGAWLARTTVLAHPARWEGFGLAVLEAMLAGLPVVASNVSSLPELVEDGQTGYLVRPDDPDALGAALARALEQPALGIAGRDRAHAEFSVARIADRTAALYARVAGA
jgi:glycosyltransferase involved in cell wall biosynthesis